MRPGITALLDQADAASTHASTILATLAAHEGQPIHHTQPGPVMAALIRRMQQRAITGQLTLCPHLSYTRPAPAYWCAWAPGRLRCVSCAHTANTRIRGTAEDRRCDRCRRIVPKIHADIAQLPPVVIDLPPFATGCIPPIALMFGLCPACQLTDKGSDP